MDASSKPLHVSMSDAYLRESIWNELFQNLMEFVFPDGVTHPRSAARLYAWALYGPAVPNAKSARTMPPAQCPKTASKRRTVTKINTESAGGLTLRGGNREFSPLILRHELALLLKDVAKQFVVDVYSGGPVDSISGGTKTLKDQEYENILQHAPPVLLRALEFTVQEVEELAKDALKQSPRKVAKPAPAAQNSFGKNSLPKAVAKSDDGGSKPSTGVAAASEEADAQPDLSQTMEQSNATIKKHRELMFTVFSDCILKERNRRAKGLQSADVHVEAVRTDLHVVKPKQASVYNKNHIKPYSIENYETPTDIARALHRGATAVSLITYGPSVTNDVSQNVKLLRSERELKDGDLRVGWDPYCCVRQGGHSRQVSKVTI
jgi:hypothetical protein